MRRPSHFALLLALVALARCGGDDRGDGGIDVVHQDVHHAGDGPDALCATDVDCSDGDFCDGVELCLPGAPGSDHYGCVTAPLPACRASQTCDATHQRCVTDCNHAPDADGDGHRDVSCGGDDCDDADPNRFPGNTEVCDARSHDEDCDPTTFGYRDQDGDSYGDAVCCNVDRAGNRMCGNDCDDHNPRVHPGAPEVCDGLDNDCNGRVDDGVTGSPFYPDADGDGFGDAHGAVVMACTAPAGTVADHTDCDDTNAMIHPGATEACDGRDSDCSSGGGPAPEEDHDGDMYSPPTAACTGGFPKTDCNDTDAMIHPGATEVCDRLDSDCSAAVPGGVEPAEDQDGDSYASPSAACTGGFPKTDCDDANPTVHPGATEVCDRVDSDCSSGGGVALDEDHDADGYAAPTAPCAGGYAKTDCDDTNAMVHPGATEVCNAIDDNCDGDVDRACPASLVLGTPRTTTTFGTGGASTAAEHCQPNNAVVGFQWHGSGSTLDGLGFRCSPLRTVMSSGSPAMYTVGTTTARDDLTPVAGTSVATYTDVDCPAGYVSQGFAINPFGGFYMPSQPCIQHRITGTPASFTVGTGPTMPAGAPSSQITCMDNEVIVGANIFWDMAGGGGVVRGLQLVCAPVTVTYRP